MAFSDNPEIDPYSKNSEESVLAVKQFLMQKHGFIVRDEVPDKGVDFDVELILDTQASGFKFAIQLKSVEKAKFVIKRDIQYLAYSIKTSRLGYLCRRPPGFALLIIYDDKTQITYYEYVEEIVETIDKLNNNDIWRENQTVTVYINAENIMDRTSISSIHSVMNDRFISHQNMYSKHASEFGLPDFKQRVNNDIGVLIEKHGYILLNNRDYYIIYDYFSKLPLNKIIDNPKLLLLAAITYNEIGQHIEGVFFLNKCKKYFNNYTDTEKELILLFQEGAEYHLGKIDKARYLDKLKSMVLSIKSTSNCLLIKLQILFLEMTNVNVFETESLEEILANLDTLITSISTVNIDEENRQYYTLEILSIMHQIGIQHFYRYTAEALIKKRTLGEAPLKERLSNAHDLTMLIVTPMRFLQGIYDYSKNADNAHLEAAVLFKKAYMFQGFIMANLASNLTDEITLNKFKEQQEPQLFEQSYQDVIYAYNIFNKKGDLRQAYQTLAMSLEVNYIYSFLFGKNIDDSTSDATQKHMVQLESKLSIEPNNIISEKMITGLMARSKTDITSYASFPEESHNSFARFFIQANGLPPERECNVIAEINFMKKAEAVINMKYFEILQNLSHTQSKETLYSTPPRHIIKCKSCNYETIESDKLDELLECLNAQHGHICF